MSDPNATPIPGGTPQQAAPAPAPAAPPAAGNGSITPPAQPDREAWIPRERFDQINNELAETRQQLAYLVTQQPPAPAAMPAPAAQPAADGIPSIYRSWEEWHAAEPGQAIDWRSRQAVQQERQRNEFLEGRQKFLQDVYTEVPALRDPLKRNSDPVYQQFTKLLLENPAAGASYSGLKQVWKLAKVEAGQSPATVQAAQAQGAQSEQQRQAFASAGYTPPGAGSPPPGTQPPAVQLSPEQQKVANKYGLTPQEYTARAVEGPSRIAMKYERAKR